MSKDSAMDILLLEPDMVLADTYMEAMSQAGFRAVWQTSAQDAVAAIDSREPSCIVMELQLPGNNGLEFLHELRSYVEWRDIPVILLTFVPELELGLSPRHKKELGVSRYCYKPRTSVEQLVRYISQLVEVRV